MKHFDEKDVAKVKSVSQESTKEKNKNDAQKKRECTCWNKTKGCKCQSWAYPAPPCICCKFHNKTLPPQVLSNKGVWVQTRYPNRFILRFIPKIRPLVPYESDYERLWRPSGAIRSNGQEILFAPGDGYD